MKYLLLLLILVNSAIAAEITGNIYDYSLEPLSDVLVTVDTEPKQQYISKNGSYHFNVPIGAYTLIAVYNSNGRTVQYFEEDITVASEGLFIFDIVMFPSLADEEELSNDLNIDVSDVTEENGILWPYILVGTLIAALIAFWLWKKPKQTTEDDTYNQVLDLIKAHKRITQKEIRKEIPMSEAKISLVITELESQDKIKKIKKGRGNVIVLR